MTEESDKRQKVGKFRHIRKKLGWISLIIFCVLIIRSILIEPFRIPSGSMIPTLMIGDFILVNKMAYGMKVPFSGTNLFGLNFRPIYLFSKRDPERGDVVVFKYPKDKSIDFVKRVIGLPGDTIEIRNKRVFINGEAISYREIEKERFAEEMDEKFKDVNLRFYESAIENKKYTIQVDEDNFYRTNLSAKKIPDYMYFVLGDNRDFSHDSRFWGFVHKKDIKGKAFLIWFSFNFKISSSNNDSLRFRLNRIGKFL